LKNCIEVNLWEPE